MRSIQARLIVGCALASMVLSAGTGLLLYRLMRADLVREFDRSLLARAQALSTLLTVDEHGNLDFEYTEQSVPEFQAHRAGERGHAAYFVFRRGDGSVYALSGSLSGKPPLVLPGNAQAGDLILPSGMIGRAVRLRFIPAPDPEIERHHEIVRASGAGAMTLLVARERSELDDSLARLVRVLTIATGLLALTLVGVCALIVRISLRPLRAMADSMTRIEPSNLDQRISADGIPKELQPICQRLNDLLDRLERAFVRERRFTSDVAHELRTPIAELRAITEVALRWPDDRAGTLKALRDSREIAMQLQTLVTALLALVRSEHSPEKVLRCDEIALGAAVERVLEESSAPERHMNRPEVVIQIPQHAIVHAEPALLASILRNLLSNAREYADDAVAIRCSAERSGMDWVLRIENCAPNLTSDDLPHLFEPFWRKDPARSDCAHAGLGLSLVRAYCRLMGAQIDAELSDHHILQMKITLPGARSSSDHVGGDNFATPARAVRVGNGS
jgi:signal transduction histidine kinase